MIGRLGWWSDAVEVYVRMYVHMSWYAMLQKRSHVHRCLSLALVHHEVSEEIFSLYACIFLSYWIWSAKIIWVNPNFTNLHENNNKSTFQPHIAFSLELRQWYYNPFVQSSGYVAQFFENFVWSSFTFVEQN